MQIKPLFIWMSLAKSELFRLSSIRSLRCVAGAWYWWEQTSRCNKRRLFDIACQAPLMRWGTRLSMPRESLTAKAMNTLLTGRARQIIANIGISLIWPMIPATPRDAANIFDVAYRSSPLWTDEDISHSHAYCFTKMHAWSNKYYAYIYITPLPTTHASSTMGVARWWGEMSITYWPLKIYSLSFAVTFDAATIVSIPAKVLAIARRTEESFRLIDVFPLLRLRWMPIRRWFDDTCTFPFTYPTSGTHVYHATLFRHF